MQVQLTNPELEKFITEKVSSGQFPTPAAVIEDALARMMQDDAHPLTDADLRAIAAADAEIDRGEFVDFDTFAADMRKKFRAQ